MRETRILEFKETITNTFLKTVSAFSNYDGGTILFGVDDDGNVKGLSDVKQACLDIENKINDSISPQPNYTLEIQNNEQTIKLTVTSGLQKPYLYKSKAYKRNDTATIEVDTLGFSRLVLDGKNIRFEELPCKDQDLSFEVLQRKLKESIQIKTFNQDTLRTLTLVVMFFTWLSATVFHILSGIICITAVLGYGFGQETGTEAVRMLVAGFILYILPVLSGWAVVWLETFKIRLME